MKILSLDEIDLEETYFHFDVRSIDYIEQYGFPPDIGNDSKNAEKTPKVFFSKGINGVLDIIDVWLIWRMNKDNENESSWTMEFLTEEYLKNEKKKNITFENMYEWLKLRKYYKLDLIPYIDFIPNDLDEAKKQALDNKKECENTNKKPWKYLFAMQMYKGKIKHYDVTMEDFNMHTKTNCGVSKDSITLLKTNDGKFDALSIVIELYDKFNAKKEFRILDEFILYCKNKHYTLVEEVNSKTI